LSDSVLVEPWNVGVAPSTVPEEEAIVRLCARGAMLVKAIATAPALAVSAVVLYFSWPSGSEARASACPPPPVAAAGVEDAAELELDGAGALVELEADELVLLELPHPDRATTPSASVSIEAREIERALG
jgi:hypothetical protein